MFLTRTEYDRGVNTFSPEGRLFQVEYAIEAIKLGSTAIGLKTKEGVVLAVEKRITSPLLEPTSVEKIMEIDEHIGCAMSGLIADARTLVEHARVETQNHRFSYGEQMTVESTTQALCDLALRFGEGDEESMSRPFGVSLLIAGHDENGPSLYYTDPSGTFWQCNAKAIGSGSEGADSSLQEQFNKDLTLQEAETIALSILKQVMEEKVTPNNVDIAKVAPTYHLYTPAEVEADFTCRTIILNFILTCDVDPYEILVDQFVLEIRILTSVTSSNGYLSELFAKWLLSELETMMKRCLALIAQCSLALSAGCEDNYLPINVILNEAREQAMNYNKNSQKLKNYREGRRVP
ncbi:hypothetical protein ACFE04_021722 [Oxalis oulophora]